MSYILDALRKAERERHLGQPPNLAIPSAPDRPERQRHWFWLGVGLVLGLNAMLLAAFLIRPQPAAISGTVPATMPSPAAAAPAESPPVAPPAIPMVPQPVRAMASKPDSPATATAAPARTPAGKPVVLEPPRPTAPGNRERDEAPPRRPATDPITPAEPEPAPTLETLPAGTRRGIPALSLDIHVYSHDSDKRFAVINGRRYREGERTGEGPTLEAVTADGAILRQGGQRFRLPVRR